MAQNLSYSLQITLIGMSLVFGTIILLWALMALLVHFSKEEETDGEEMIIISSGTTSNPAELRKRAAVLAAAIAVAAAISRRAESMTPHPYPLPPTPIVSAWQAVLRTRMISKRRFRQ